MSELVNSVCSHFHECYHITHITQFMDGKLIRCALHDKSVKRVFPDTPSPPVSLDSRFRISGHLFYCFRQFFTAQCYAGCGYATVCRLSVYTKS